MTLYRQLPPIDHRAGLCRENLSGDHTPDGPDPRELWTVADFRKEQEFLASLDHVSVYMVGITKAVLRKNEFDERAAKLKVVNRG